MVSTVLAVLISMCAYMSVSVCTLVPVAVCLQHAGWCIPVGHRCVGQFSVVEEIPSMSSKPALLSTNL
jgi:hypothetical protein